MCWSRIKLVNAYIELIYSSTVLFKEGSEATSSLLWPVVLPMALAAGAVPHAALPQLLFALVKSLNGALLLINGVELGRLTPTEVALLLTRFLL